MALLTPEYQTEFYLGVVQALARTVDVFNEASANTILLGSEDYDGSFIKEAMYQRIPNLVRRRDVTVDTAATSLRMALAEHVGVDVAHTIGPVTETLENFKRRGRSLNEFSNVIGQQFADDFIARGLDILVSAIVAATDGQTALKSATRAGEATSFKHLLDAQRLFGDQHRNVAAYLMNSEAYFDLTADALDNYKMDSVAGVQVVEGNQKVAMGRPIIVADIPALNYDAGSGDKKNRILALTQGAGSVIERTGREFVVQEVTGLENLSFRFQGETNTVISLKGYAWDTAAGINPTDAAIATTANWKLMTDAKLAAASMVISEAAN